MSFAMESYTPDEFYLLLTSTGTEGHRTNTSFHFDQSLNVWMDFEFQEYEVALLHFQFKVETGVDIEDKDFLVLSNVVSEDNYFVNHIPTPVLRWVTFKYSGRKIIEFEYPTYVTVKAGRFKKINIHTQTLGGKVFTYLEGTTKCLLHFRRKNDKRK